MFKKITKKSMIGICLLIIFLFVFKGYILGFCIEKYRDFTNYEGVIEVTGSLKHNYSYSYGGSIGGLGRGNYSLKDSSTGIIYRVDMDETYGYKSTGTPNTFNVIYSGDKFPSANLK